MKRLVSLTIAVIVMTSIGLLARGSTQELTAEAIVAKCAEAMGGEKGFVGVKSLRFMLKHADSARDIYWEIKRPDKVRKERPGRMVLVFDGSRAAFLEGPPSDDGSRAGPHLVPEKDWHDFELDIALYVPAFFEYPAEYVGMEPVGDSPAHLLQVKLPMGDRVVYSVDAKSFLPVRIYLPSWNYKVFLGDYKKIDGVTYFHRFWSSPDEKDATVLDELAFNVDPKDARFAIPAGIKQ